DGPRVPLESGLEQLQGVRLLEHQLVRAVHPAHPPLAEQLLDPVLPGHPLAEVGITLLLARERVSAGAAELGVGGGLGGAGRTGNDRKATLPLLGQHRKAAWYAPDAHRFGMAFCPRCDAPNPDDRERCSRCGASLAGGTMVMGPPSATRPQVS